jgi:hypothetical protein
MLKLTGKIKAKKYWVAICAALAAVLTIADLLLAAWFTSAPRLPSVAAGQVVPYNLHGSTVYITAWQNVFHNWASVGSAFAIALACISAFWAKRKPSDKCPR